MRAAEPGLRELAGGLGLVEGPAWTPRGTLVVSSMSRGLVYEIEPDGSARELAETGGGPNGLAVGGDGSIWVAQNGGGHLPTRSRRPVRPGIQRISQGRVEDVLTGGVDSPCDLTFGPDGRLWFSDLRGRPVDGVVEPGRVQALEPESMEIEVVAEGILIPNGVAFSPDGGSFYVAETATGRVLRADHRRGGLGRLEAFATLPRGEPDGLATDALGNLYVAAAGDGNAVFFYGPDGDLAGEIPVGAGERTVVTNVCFGGPGLKSLFVTVLRGGRVLTGERGVGGWA